MSKLCNLLTNLDFGLVALIGVAIGSVSVSIASLVAEHKAKTIGVEKAEVSDAVAAEDSEQLANSLRNSSVNGSGVWLGFIQFAWLMGVLDALMPGLFQGTAREVAGSNSRDDSNPAGVLAVIFSRFVGQMATAGTNVVNRLFRGRVAEWLKQHEQSIVTKLKLYSSKVASINRSVISILKTVKEATTGVSNALAGSLASSKIVFERAEESLVSSSLFREVVLGNGSAFGLAKVAFVAVRKELFGSESAKAFEVKDSSRSTLVVNIVTISKQLVSEVVRSIRSVRSALNTVEGRQTIGVVYAVASSSVSSEDVFKGRSDESLSVSSLVRKVIGKAFGLAKAAVKAVSEELLGSVSAKANAVKSGLVVVLSVLREAIIVTSIKQLKQLVKNCLDL